jgi:hypothetical protein
LANLITPTCGEQTATLYGARFKLDMSDFIQRNMYAGSFEWREARAVRDILLSGMTFVDVGANVGFYTALAAEAVGRNGTVLAFEPSDCAYSRLRTMVDSNSLRQVRVLKCGLGEAPGVEIDTLDRIAARLKIHRIDFLRINVDGYEPLVLRGARGLLRGRRISNILMECSEYWLNRLETSATELLGQLASQGFTRIIQIGASDNYLLSL